MKYTDNLPSSVPKNCVFPLGEFSILAFPPLPRLPVVVSRERGEQKRVNCAVVFEDQLQWIGR